MTTAQYSAKVVTSVNVVRMTLAECSAKVAASTTSVKVVGMTWAECSAKVAASVKVTHVQIRSVVR